jgi:hypothetical protein
VVRSLAESGPCVLLLWISNRPKRQRAAWYPGWRRSGSQDPTPNSSASTRSLAEDLLAPGRMEARFPRIPGVLPTQPGCASQCRSRGALVLVATWLGVPVAAPVAGRITGRVLPESAPPAGMGGTVDGSMCRPASRLRHSFGPSSAPRSPPGVLSYGLSPASLQTVEAGSYARPGNPPIARSRTPSGPGRILRRAVAPTRMVWSASSVYRWSSTCTSAEPRSAI